MLARSADGFPTSEVLAFQAALPQAPRLSAVAVNLMMGRGDVLAVPVALRIARDVEEAMQVVTDAEDAVECPGSAFKGSLKISRLPAFLWAV